MNKFISTLTSFFFYNKVVYKLDLFLLRYRFSFHLDVYIHTSNLTLTVAIVRKKVVVWLIEKKLFFTLSIYKGFCLRL